jgi:hypothetical protein
MNLARHAAVLWRFRSVTAAGVVIAVGLAIFAGYHVSPSGLTPRGTSTYSAASQILVTQAGFPEGRVTLPTKQIDVTEADGDDTEFADPGRLSALGDLYSKFLTSDQVLSRVPGHPGPGAVTASPFQSSSGGLLLPVIQLQTMGPTAEAARLTNLNTYKALLDFMDEESNASDIPEGRRVQLEMIVQPAVVLTSRPKPTASVLVFLLVMLGTVAVTHILEALRQKRQTTALATIVDWDAPTPVVHGAVHEPAPRSATRAK